MHFLSRTLICVRGYFLLWRPMFDEIRNQRGWLLSNSVPLFLVSFLPTPRVCGKELLSKTVFILCITLDWRLQASFYCHWISDVVCFATCHLNVSSHTRKRPRLGKFYCILFCIAKESCFNKWVSALVIFHHSHLQYESILPAFIHSPPV